MPQNTLYALFAQYLGTRHQVDAGIAPEGNLNAITDRFTKALRAADDALDLSLDRGRTEAAVMRLHQERAHGHSAG